MSGTYNEALIFNELQRVIKVLFHSAKCVIEVEHKVIFRGNKKGEK
jgi:hypothetical protein